MIKLCGLALFSAVLYMILKEIRGTGAVFLGVSTTILLCAAAILTLTPVYDSISEMLENTELISYAGIILKALGVAYAAEITSEICRAGGAESAASGIEIVGRAELTVLSLPLIKELFNLASSFF